MSNGVPLAMANEDRLVVYTSVLGSGYLLPPTQATEGVDYVCFTDDVSLSPNGWILRFVEPVLPADLARSSRETKIRPHRWLPDHRRSLFVDPSVQLLGDPRRLWSLLIGGSDAVVFGGMLHSFRDSLEAEFEAVLADGLDAEHIVLEQLDTYRRTDPAALQERPVIGGILARRHHDPTCIELMERWYAHVMRYSRRDQLSLTMILAAGPDGAVHRVDGDIRRSDFHQWPIKGYARPLRYFEELRSTGRDGATVARLTSERDAARVERDIARAELRAIEGSRIWRATAAYRRLRDRIRESRTR